MENISFDLIVDDLESVFNAAGVDQAPIITISQGGAIAAAFAARAPERVIRPSDDWKFSAGNGKAQNQEGSGTRKGYASHDDRWLGRRLSVSSRSYG